MNSLIISPTFNESKNISTLVKTIFERNPNIHLLIVDDSSPDGTGDIVRKLQRDYPNLFLETRIYAPKINLYLSAKSGKENKLFTEGGSIFLGGIGYEYYLNKFISINSEISYYRYEREWTHTTISYTGSTNSDPLDFFDGWNSNTVEYYERHFAPAFSIVLQIHF